MKMSTTTDKTIYHDNHEHLEDELTRLDLLIQLGVLKQRSALPGTESDRFKGILLSDREIDLILRENLPDPQKTGLKEEDDTRVTRLENTCRELEERISQRKQNALAKGVYLALPRLARMLGLNPSEETVVLICLAPELHRKYEKLYAYLQDDITRKKPGVDMILNLLCTTKKERITARSYFMPRAPLLKCRILHLLEDPRNPSSPPLAKFLKLDNRIVDFLLGTGGLDETIEPVSTLLYPQTHLNQVPLDPDLKTRLIGLTKKHVEAIEPQQEKLVYYFHGPYGSGRQLMAEAICSELRAPLIVCDVRELLAGQLPFEETVRFLFREALLQPAAVYLKGFQYLLNDNEKYLSYLNVLVRAVEDFSWLTFLAGDRPWEPAGLFNRHVFISVEFPIPCYSVRAESWKTKANGKYRFSNHVDFDALAAKFRFTPGQITDALVAAQNLAIIHLPDAPEISMKDLYQACRAQCNQKLETMALKVSAKYTWDDIVLPDEALWLLQAICGHVKYKHRVYSQWGFNKKLSLGKGINALFSGPSGTGKTMAAEIIANELQLDLYKIDLSNVVSKYIGETEKNLSKIFYEAETSNAILFFDEADALFGKRSEVKDAHDRYANIETGYLLQKMEEYEGISILATNLKKNMDDAFMRRLHFLVEFPFPDETYRFRIWKQMFPKETPMSKNIDFDFLSKGFKIAGGNIKNIAVNAAFLAAGNSGIVNMEDIIQATKQEYRKIGRPYVKSDFGKYSDLVMRKEV